MSDPRSTAATPRRRWPYVPVPGAVDDRIASRARELDLDSVLEVYPAAVLVLGFGEGTVVFARTIVVPAQQHRRSQNVLRAGIRVRRCGPAGE